MADDPGEALRAAGDVGYPVLVRPSYVLGGRAMAICDSPEALARYLERERPEGALLVDRFLEDATELDVDALSDGRDCWSAAVMEHVEAAGVHSGDSACVLPPQGAGPGLVAEIEEQTAALARALGAVGLLNVQFAVRDGRVYVIEANPRASRTVPFVAKATGVPLVRHAVRLMLGASLDDLDLPVAAPARQVAVKEAVLPFARFPGADPVLGPEMRATGEVMGLGGSFPEAFAKAQRGAGQALPRSGAAFISARDADKPRAVALAARLGAGRPEPRRDHRHGRGARRGGPARSLGQQGLRGVAPRGRPHRRRGGGPRGQHAAGGPRRAHRRLRDPGRRRPCRHPLHHDDRGRRGGRLGGRRGPPGAAAGAPGRRRRAGRCAGLPTGPPDSFSLNLRGRFWRAATDVTSPATCVKSR